MTDDTINIGQAPDQTPTVNITPTTPQVDVQTANLRADKARFGLSKYLPDYTKDAWYTSIISGQEGEARKAASASINYADTQRRLQELHDTGKLSPPNLSNPDSVIETGFANQFMHPMTDMSNDFYKQSLYGDANRENPVAVGDIAAKAAAAGTVSELANTYWQGIKDRVAGAGQDVSQRFLNPDILPTFVPSAALDVMGAAFAPVSAIDDVLDKVFPSLKKARDQGQIIPLETVSEAVSVAALGLGMGHLTTEMSDAARGAIKALSVVDGTRPVETVVNAAHGDLQTAAQHQVAADINSGNSPRAERDRDIRSLTSNFRLDMDKIQENPGNYGQDLVNRIRDANNGLVDNLSKKIQTVMKVNRTPQVSAWLTRKEHSVPVISKKWATTGTRHFLRCSVTGR